MKNFHFFPLASLMIACGGSIPRTASAYDYCVAPDEPACISSRYAFENEFVATRCRRDVERFSREIENYVNCIDQLKLEYLQKGSQTLTRLNCRIRGELRC